MIELNDVLDRIAADKNIKGVIFTSAKPDNFIAGADVKVIKSLQSESPEKLFEASQKGKFVFEKITDLGIPTVAAIHGKCMGGGTEFTLFCRYRLATSAPATSISLPELKLGIVPGWGATVRLAKLVGLQSALMLILTSKELDGRKAWKLNLVDECVDQNKLLQRAQEIVRGDQPKRYVHSLRDRLLRFALEKPAPGRALIYKNAYKSVMRETKGKYPAHIDALKLIIKNFTMHDVDAYEAESNVFAHLAASDISHNLVNIFFAQSEAKKLPANIGNLPEIKTVGVLGAGIMGAGIAQAAAYAGYKVVLKDIEQKFVDHGLSKVGQLFDGLVSRHKIKSEERDKLLAAIKGTTNYEDLQDCDLIIEAVLEDIKVKSEVLSHCEHLEKKPFIFATNTSSLSVNQLAQVSTHPDKVVGIHFFNPVHKMPLVEIVRGDQTAPETLAAAQAFALKLGKTTVITGDAPGFVVNRVLAPYLREAIILLEQGVSPELIDRAATSFGMPMGPLTLLDEIGLDIGIKVMHVLYEAFGERLSPPALLNTLTPLKLLGRKGARDFIFMMKKVNGVSSTLMFWQRLKSHQIENMWAKSRTVCF